MTTCFSEDKPIKLPNFSHYRRSFLYTPCNCPLTGCEFSNVEKPPSKARNYRCSSRRIRQLSKPKYHGAKFHQRPVTQYGRTIQMIQTYKEPLASSRIQQLAVPKVRKLIAAREAYKRFLNRCWYDRFNKRIRRSMYTVYSRLANVQPPSAESRPPQTMTPEQWSRHQEWLTRNARPKPLPSMKTKRRKRMPLAELLDRIESLAAPRWAVKKYSRPVAATRQQPEFAVKRSALKAVPTDRLRALCVPKERHRRAKGPIVEDTAIPEEVLKAVASERVVELSKPKVYRNVKNEYRENPFTVEPRALKAKASDRILELARPKKVKK